MTWRSVATISACFFDLRTVHKHVHIAGPLDLNTPLTPAAAGIPAEIRVQMQTSIDRRDAQQRRCTSPAAAAAAAAGAPRLAATYT
jgi:hypothetical protein